MGLDKGYKDDDVIKTLKNAKYKVDGVVSQGVYLSVETFNAVVDLIGRQKAKNESLKKVLNELKMEAEMVYKQRDAQKNRADSIAKFARAEAIKEFADNVVQELWSLNWHYGQIPCSEEDKTIQRAIKECIAVVERNTKVMTEGNHESQNT